jgi:cyclin B
MRAILIDWLVDVHLKFKLVPETLFLTISLIDRYLEKRAVKRQKLQLVGVTAMLIASKYEEIYAPEVHDFVYISDRAYTHEEILSMENSILNSLEFRITSPSTLKFMTRYAKIAQGDSTVSLLSNYYAERMLPEYTVLKWTPSQLGATALALARRTVGKTLWVCSMCICTNIDPPSHLICSFSQKPDLEQYSGYSEAVLTQSYNTMLDLMQPNAGSGRKSNLQAVLKKYSSPKFGEVAKMYALPNKI